MPIVFSCPCGNQLKAEDQHVGLKVRCPRCAQVLIAPAASGALAKLAAAPPPPTPVQTVTPEPPPQRRSVVSRPHGEAPERDDWEKQEQEPLDVVPFPRLVRIAGIIWIIFGSLILLNALVNLMLSAAFFIAGGQKNLAVLGLGVVCPVLIGVFFGSVFVHVGLQSIRGTARGTLGNGIGSIIFGMLYAAFGVLLLIVGMAANETGALIGEIGGSISLLAGIGLLAAGLLALLGGSDYKAWRRVHKKRFRRN